MSRQDPTAKEAFERGMHLLDAGRNEEALSLFTLATETAADHPAVWNNKGVALKNLGRFEEAVVCFDAALAINRKFADPWINKADVMVKLGRLREAIAAFKEFIRYAPRELAATVSAVKTTLRRLESQCAKE